MKIESIDPPIYSPGTSKDREDGLIINPPFFGVIDGTSAVHTNPKDKILFDGVSGGEMVRETAQEVFCSADNNRSLKDIVLQANQRIGEIQKSRGIALDDSGKLAGASFVFAKVTRSGVEIIQGGDCFALWLLPLKSSSFCEKIEITRNQVYLHDKENLRIIAGLMKKHKGNYAKMWQEFGPILYARRLQNVNKTTEAGYAHLNGQPWLTNCWHWTFTAPPRLLILFSDGLVDFQATANPEALAREVLKEYKEGGLERLLDIRRNQESIEKGQSHINHQEITAIAIKFSPD